MVLGISILYSTKVNIRAYRKAIIAVKSLVILNPDFSYIQAPKSGPITSPRPFAVLKTPEDRLFTRPTYVGYWPMTDSTIEGSARIRPTGMKRPSRTCPIIMIISVLSMSELTKVLGPTQKRDKPQKIMPIIMTARLSHYFGIFSTTTAEGM